MIRPHNLGVALLVLTLSAAWTAVRAGETSKVVGSIDVGAGEHTGDLSTVNGSIHVGEHAVVGSARTVNGGIEPESHAGAAELKTVNGSVHLAQAVRIGGNVRTVNGKLRLEDGAEVSGQLRNVNGAIRIAAAHVGGGIQTTTGSIELGPDAHVEGGIHMEKDDSSVNSESPPRVVVAAGSVVAGTLRFDRPVKLYVSERATIGPVEGAVAVPFSGAEPPN
jgi:DUF4097 and DUF4098 domain-containing protein YvlB